VLIGQSRGADEVRELSSLTSQGRKVEKTERNKRDKTPIARAGWGVLQAIENLSKGLTKEIK
jgi:hypothetical protein